MALIAPPAVLRAGTAAMRNTKRGSWYIEALTQVFSERACDMHVADMLVRVSVPPPSSPALVFLGGALVWFGLVFLLFRATPAAYGSSQARDQIGAAAAGLHHSHSNARSKPRL